MSAACNSCGAEIVWAITDKGKRMPVDAQPCSGGNLTMTEQTDGTFTVSVADKVSQRGTALHRSHFATCPNANTHRRAR